MEASFASDNFSPVHPDVMAALEKANKGAAVSYGADRWTEEANLLFKKTFGPDAETFFVFNGTAANVCSLKHFLAPWQAILCAESAHIWNNECGAPQAIIGSSLLTVPTHEGKINSEGCEEFLSQRGDQHRVQPAALSITQSTELGTVYQIEELENLSRFVKKKGLILHIDGARLCNAAATLGASLKNITTDIGADILSFGGTKNGLMGVEAVVFLKKEISSDFQYLRKQQLQLASKMRFLSAQMIALLEKDLWLRNASHSNAMAKELEGAIRKQCPSLQILYPVEANAVFVQFPSQERLKKFQEKEFFWIWDEKKGIARWMTSWDTTSSSIQDFVSELARVLH